MNGLTVTQDLKGKHPPSHKLSCQAAVIEDIESYKPHVSHYTLENAPNRRYIDINISTKKMWTDFNPGNTKGGQFDPPRFFQLFSETP